MKPNRFHAAAVAAMLLAAVAALVPAPACAQRAQSRLAPLIVNPSAEAIGPSMRMKDERVDLSTITREDRSLRIGRELVQGESVTTIRTVRDQPTSDTSRQRHESAIREQDDTRHKREAAIYDD
ncbi:MAG: hypothetical protein IKO01_00485 [Kiritimatiellae bacterium]|nr:hypothetical protein [Kiritimatiellia bacterium]